MNCLKKVLFFAVIPFLFASHAQASSPEPSLLKFFNGEVVMKATWLSNVALRGNASLKLEVTDAQGASIDVDPASVSAKLIMEDMPDMGSETPEVVSIYDGGGNPIPGSLVIKEMHFTMSGGWVLQITMQKPSNSAESDTQSIHFKVQN